MTRKHTEEVWSALVPDGSNLAIEDFLSVKLTALTVLLQRRVTRRYLEAHDISLSEWRMLALLIGRTPISAVEVNQQSGMDKAQISRSLILLQHKRMVVRRADPDDGRRQILDLTAKGRAIFDAIMRDARGEQARVLLGLSVAERRRLLHLINKITELVERLPSREQNSRARPKARSAAARPTGRRRRQSPLIA